MASVTKKSWTNPESVSGVISQSVRPIDLDILEEMCTYYMLVHVHGRPPVFLTESRTPLQKGYSMS